MSSPAHKPEIFLYQDDLPDNLDLGNVVAIDTESLGLQVRRDRLCLVQLSSGDGKAHLVQFSRDKYHAPNLVRLLQDDNVLKLFHFARADIAMMAKWLGAMARPVFCTKIASLIARTYTDRHGLKDLARDLLSIDLSKEQQTSDWGQGELSKEQRSYAASDVLYLHKIMAKLETLLEREGRLALAREVFAALPARAALDIAGWENIDIFAHTPNQRR